MQATVIGFCGSGSSGVIRNGRTLPLCPRKQDTCLLFSTEEDYVVNLNPDLGSY